GKMPTPPRVSMVTGSVSFWRPGAEAWSPAAVNTALAGGDALYTGDGAGLELQIGSRAFLRAAQQTTFSLIDDTPDLLQFRLTSGIAALDLRTLPGGQNVEVDTPNGAFSIDSPGYYRVEIVGEQTHFIVRRDGQAVLNLPDGQRESIAASEETI